MAKNLIPEIAKMLGVELGEEFKIGNNNVRFWFDLDGLHSEEFETADLTLYRLTCGKAEIVKQPWKPKADDKYWTFALRYNNAAPDKRTWRIVPSIWTEHPSDWALLDKGWVYKTKGEAIKALPTVAREAGVEYELPTSDTEAVEPWKPKKGETYYTFYLLSGKWVVHLLWCCGSPNEYALLEKGWVYRSKEEAEAALPKVAKERGVEYEI